MIDLEDGARKPSLMFSGIVEETGTIRRIERGESSIRLAIEAARVARGARIGDSFAVNGCCLTLVKKVRRRAGTEIHFDLLEETWSRTSFQQSAVGALVNLEAALRVGDRLGGHFVTGHVDGTGEIVRWERSGSDWVLEIRPPAEVMRYLLWKGSVTVDGISLTVADVFEDCFRLWIIPHTWEVTNLRERRVGDRVNLEADLLGKYVERLIEGRESARPSRGLPWSKARRSGRAAR